MYFSLFDSTCYFHISTVRLFQSKREKMLCVLGLITLVNAAQNDTYLVINRYRKSNRPVLFTWPLNGNEEVNHIGLSFRDVDLNGSCSAIYKNEVYFFGGKGNPKTISKLEPNKCSVTKESLKQRSQAANYHTLAF